MMTCSDIKIRIRRPVEVLFRFALCYHQLKTVIL